MNQISQRDLQTLAQLFEKFASFSDIEQALINDAKKGIILSGETGAYQALTYKRFKAQAYLKKTIAILDADSDSFGMKLGELILEHVPKDRKIAILKIVRGLTGFALKEAKQLVEDTPSLVLTDYPTREVKEAAKALEEAGAKVSMRFYGFEIEELEPFQ